MAGESRRRKVDDQLSDKALTVSGDVHYGPPETPPERTSRLLP